jgi:ectoine hydroxylase-related dioxygenase (phytanoyl-CoA dioxygenase family)
MMALHAGEKRIEGYEAPDPDSWERTHNQHRYDPVAKDLLLNPRLLQPLADCFGDDPLGVQTMYFWKGSEQHWHQDQFYLPGCMSAWIALIDVSDENGTIQVQPGSHKEHLLTFGELKEKHGVENFTEQDPIYNSEIDALVERNQAESGLSEMAVEVNAGDVVLFHGVLIHRGGPIKKPRSFRHVMANHYIPENFDGWPWPEEAWPRLGFDD